MNTFDTYPEEPQTPQEHRDLVYTDGDHLGEQLLAAKHLGSRAVEATRSDQPIYHEEWDPSF